jgi:ribonucleoside-diphosphate reductase alpha chain
MTYTYKRALKESTDYFSDELSASIFVTKYALKDKQKRLLELTPTDMHRRIARELARVEQKKFDTDALTEDEIFEYIDHFKHIIPQGSPMFGIGNPNFVTLSNCYVIDPPLDSYGGIMWTDEQIVQISKRRGGSGTDISHLRPNHTPTQNSSSTSTGTVCFANRYSNSSREVGQDGRRGAVMLTLDVHHPDVVEFAQCKHDRTKCTGVNISIRLSDEFLKAVQKDEDYEQRWSPLWDDDGNKWTGPPKISGRVSARSVWNDIIQNAHADAEPGLLFWDKIISESPADCYPLFQTVSTNPCSELPLSVLDSCRLLLLNVLGFVNDAFTTKAAFDWSKFYDYVKIAQRLMDDIVDLELEAIDKIIRKIHSDPEPERIKQREVSLWERIRNNCETGRRTGTGLTALGDTLAALGIPYGSKKALKFTDRLYKTLKFGCYVSSM